MNAEESEALFRKYLKKYCFKFSENYPVNPSNSVNRSNVDFFVTKENVKAFCDVKEVRVSESTGEFDAYNNVRKDIKRLREKFSQPPDVLVVLVSMNFSKRFFTGFTIAQALMGDTGIVFEKTTKNLVSDVQHLHNGNAALTSNKNTSISGVLVFDTYGKRHYFFRNPYANHPLPNDFFPDTTEINLNKVETGEDLKYLSKIMFWEKEMKHPENNTIEAINNLKDNYPYAAALLIYVVIERELKEYVFKNRKNLKMDNKYKYMIDDKFVKNFLCTRNATMEKIEKLLDKKIAHPSKDRNDLMHSNLYLLYEKNWSDKDRHNTNKQHFDKARRHLLQVFKQFSDYRIVEKGGWLTFEKK